METKLNLDQAFERYLPVIENELRRPFEASPAMLQLFYGMMGYHLGWVDESLSPAQPKVGKRLRPLLCMLVCRAVGGDALDALPAAAALELIHNFSLVHDDIQDNSPVRRHRRTVWTIWGRPQAINVGDGLFAMAFLNLARLKSNLPPSRVRAVYESCARACLLLCEGQYMDMSFESRLEVNEEEYLQMILRKTAALLSCASYVGVVIGSDNVDVALKYQTFGEQLGLAFQIQDDILGIWGDPKVTGKPSADDILQCKKTLPVLFALRREAELGGNALGNLYSRGAVPPEEVPAVLAILDELGALEYARRLNGVYCDKALWQLAESGSGTADCVILEELVERLRERPS